MSWMTQAEAAAALNCSIRTIRRRIRDHSLNARREGRNVLVEVSSDDTALSLSPLRVPLKRVGDMPAAPALQDSDNLAVLSASLKDTVSILSAARRGLEVQARHGRRWSQVGWLVALIAMGTLGAVSWYFHAESLGKIAEVHNLEGMLASRESGFEQELATTKAHFDGESNAAWVLLAHEELRTADLTEQNESLTDEAYTIENERDALAAGSRIAEAERDRLTAELQAARQAANLAGTFKAAWSAASVALSQTRRYEELSRVREEADQAKTEFERSLEATQVLYDAKLATAQGRFDGRTEELAASLTHERRTVAELEDRIESLNEKLVTSATDRGRLKIEQVRLAAETEALKLRLEEAQRAADLTFTLKRIFSTVRLAFDKDKSDPTTVDRQAAADYIQ